MKKTIKKTQRKLRPQSFHRTWNLGIRLEHRRIERKNQKAR